MELKNRIVNKVSEKVEDDNPFPKKNLLIEITNHCNNKCIFCYNECMHRKRKFINKELCKKILVEAYELGMREVGFYVVGEPLLDKRLKDFIHYAKTIGYEYIYITTNGILANLIRVQELYENGLNSIKYSINATNREDYKMIHKTDFFNTVIDNLTEVYQWKKKNNSNLKIYVSFVTTDKTNKKEEIEALFKNRCDEYIIMPAINQGGLIPNIKEISSTKDDDINSNWNLPCPYPFHSVIVTVEGYLTACCMDFENYLAYADLNKVSLKEAWNNAIITDFRNKQRSKKIKNTICENCIYNTKSIPKPLSTELCSITDKNLLFQKEIEGRI